MIVTAEGFEVFYAATKANKQNSKRDLDVLTVSPSGEIHYVRCLARLTCDGAALVQAIVSYCFHQRRLPFYDLSKHHTLILKAAKRAKGRNERKSKGMRETKGSTAAGKT